MPNSGSMLKESHIKLFKKIERDLDIQIPHHVKNLLICNGYVNMVTLADFGTEDIYLIERFAQKLASKNDSNIGSEFYGSAYNTFEEQKAFHLSLEHRKILRAIGKYAKFCLVKIKAI